MGDCHSACPRYRASYKRVLGRGHIEAKTMEQRASVVTRSCDLADCYLDRFCTPLKETVDAPNNTVSSTYPPNTPKTPDQCSIYNNGTTSGAALYKICQAFPNSPKSNQMRGCLQSLYNPQSGYIPLPVLIPTSPGSVFDLNSLIPGTGAHLNCAVGTLGGGS
jgi:hypothetical protein